LHFLVFFFFFSFQIFLFSPTLSGLGGGFLGEKPHLFGKAAAAGAGAALFEY